MAIETTPKNITPIKRRGIDMAVKGLGRQYPFIIGYEDATENNDYSTAHYINLIIDTHKLSEYMDVPINPFWERYLKDNPDYKHTSYSLWSYLSFDDDYLGKDIRTHPGFILMEEIKQALMMFYEYLPDEYKLFYSHQSEYFPEKPPSYHMVHLKSDKFIMT
jgi:hypothetical protein